MLGFPHGGLKAPVSGESLESESKSTNCMPYRKLTGECYFYEKTMVLESKDVKRTVKSRNDSLQQTKKDCEKPK